MNLPSAAQVTAAGRHVATFAGGALVMLGLGTKISPEQVTAIINSFTTLYGDLMTFIAAVTPIAMLVLASKSASPTSQLKSVTSNSDLQIPDGAIRAPKAIADAVPNRKVVAAAPSA